MFREEALAHYNRGDRAGDLLKLSTSWTRWTYAFSIGAFLLAIFFCSVCHVEEYAIGQAFICRGLDTKATERLSHLGFQQLASRGVSENVSSVSLQLGVEEIQRQLVAPESQSALRDPFYATVAGIVRAIEISLESMRSSRNAICADYSVPRDYRSSQANTDGNSPKRSVIGVFPGRFRTHLRTGMLVDLSSTDSHEHEVAVIESVTDIFSINPITRLFFSSAAEVDEHFVAIAARVVDDTVVPRPNHEHADDNRILTVKTAVNRHSLLSEGIRVLVRIFRRDA